MAYRDEGDAVIGRAGGEAWTAAAVAPSIVPSLVRAPLEEPSPRKRPQGPKLPRCPEIDCLRHILPPGIIALAELRSAESGEGADRILIAWGAIDEEDYVAALATWLGVAVEPLETTPRQRCPLADDRLVEAAVAGMLPLTGKSGLDIVVAPRLVDSRRLMAVVQSGTDLARRIRLAPTAALQCFAARHGADDIERRAVDTLRTTHPDLSASTGKTQPAMVGLGAAAAGLAAILAPAAALLTIELTLGLIFLSWAGLRLLGVLSNPLAYRRRRLLPHRLLPTYTIIVALYREAATVKSLVAALRGLDYPLEKLDIKFVVEPDDHETREAIAALRLGAPFETIVAPSGGPRTKPKALNAALQFARGSFVAVYDAEDQPEPNQLRLALNAFAAGGERLACVQACLTIDNTADGWLTRMFTAEYAGLFDVFLPGLAAWRLPLPLGGSSNHFRTSALRQIGAWDPYNVTEDADLGMRLVRFGYHTTVISSTTYEEAPARFAPWLRQRTRWFKGWIQTWLVHTRSPLRLVRELGWPGFATFQLVVGGTVLASLVHALFAVQLVWSLAAAPPESTTDHMILGLHMTILLSGYAISALLGGVGLARRGLLGAAWALLFMPVYWVLLSIAAWRALFQLVHAPSYWEKTDHGLARTSRLARKSQK